MEIKKDYKLMIKNIKEYLKWVEVCTGEGERIIKDIEEIIKSWDD